MRNAQPDLKEDLLTSAPSADEPRQRTSVTMADSTWARVEKAKIAWNGERVGERKRAVGRDELIELLVRRGLELLEPELAEPAKKPRR